MQTLRELLIELAHGHGTCSSGGQRCAVDVYVVLFQLDDIFVALRRTVAFERQGMLRCCLQTQAKVGETTIQ